MRSLLVSWAGAGAIVAAASVGYVGVTAAQVVSMATAEDPGVTAVADPPALAAYSASPAPTSPAPTSPTPSASAPASTAPSAPSTTRPSDPEARPARPTPPTAPGTSGRPTAERPTRTTPPARAARPATQASNRQQRLEIKHAKWADRQLAAMLRTMAPTTSPVQQWFGGAAWIVPVANYRLTAHFGESGRLWSSTHTGLDFAAPTGTPVRAATAGTVTSVGWAGAYGNRIEITHPDGTETWYCHLSRTDVRVGAQVATGAVIAAVGATGNVTGSHLHFEVRADDGSPLDPEKILQEHGIRP